MDSQFLWQRAKQFRGQLALISGLSLIGAATTLVVPWLAGQLLGDVVEGATPGLMQTLAMLVIALVALTALNIAATIASSIASHRILAELRTDIYQHVQLMPMQFHDRQRGGDLLSLMTYEVGNLSTFLASTLANVPSLLLTAAGAVVLLFVIDPGMALIIPILIPVFFIVMKLIGRRMRVIARKARKAEVQVMSSAESDIQMIPAIKAFASEQVHQQRYADRVNAARKLLISRARISAFVGPVVALIAALSAILILVIGSGDLASGEREPGDLFAFLLYAALLTRPVGNLADLYGRWQIARGTLSRLGAVLRMAPEEGYHASSRMDRAKGAIEFNCVSFAYPGRPTVLDKVSLAISAGEIVALTGPNGAGKTTLVRLMLRFYDRADGSITLDGQDINRINVQDLRRQFGYVPQRAMLFNGTIANNIAFGQTFASEEERREAIERAARLAQASEFTARLPQGLDTEIGDHGVRLSGGQRQRIALARALLRDPPIYILDEATSMYDLEAEAAFVEDCVEALKDRTVIIITHRPASLALADRVLEVTRQSISERNQA